MIIPLNLGAGSYDIVLERGSLGRAGEHLRESGVGIGAGKIEYEGLRFSGHGGGASHLSKQFQR